MNASALSYFAGFVINYVASFDEGIDFKIQNGIHALVERENKRHAQPLKEVVITLKLGDEGTPDMLQTGSTSPVKIKEPRHATNRDNKPCLDQGTPVCYKQGQQALSRLLSECGA